MATKAASVNGTGKPPVEADVLVPPPVQTITIDDEIFVICKMGVGPSMRFTRLLGAMIRQGYSGMAFAHDKDEATQRDAAVQWIISAAFSPEIMRELMSVVLSSPEKDVSPEWVEQHWSLDWVLDALPIWLDSNPLHSYLGKVQTLIARLKPGLVGLTRTG